MKYNFKSNDFLITSTGRITIDKGFKVLEKVILNGFNNNIKFLIVGEGSYKKTMMKNLSKYLDKSVFFLVIKKILILLIIHQIYLFMYSS